LLLPIIVAAVLAAGATPAGALGGFAHWQNSEDMDSGFGLGLQHQFKIVPIFSAEARAAWVGFSSTDKGPDMNMYPLEAIGRVKLGLLYGGGGIGYYLFSGDDFQPKNSVGGTILAGAEFTLLGLGAFAEARYLFLEADEEDQVGGKRKMDGFGASLGVIIPIG
jgi:hypothetical protein